MNAIEQTKAEVAHFGVVERYISDLRSKSSSLTDHEFTLIAGNIRGFYATILPMGPNEPTTMALLKEAETAIEEYSCRTQVAHIAGEMEGLASRIRAFLSGKPVQTSDVAERDRLRAALELFMKQYNACGPNSDFGRYFANVRDAAKTALAS